MFRDGQYIDEMYLKPVLCLIVLAQDHSFFSAVFVLYHALLCFCCFVSFVEILEMDLLRYTSSIFIDFDKSI